MISPLSRACLITGAQGFLGGFLRQEAIARGYAAHDTRGLRLPSEQLIELVREAKPSAVIHAAGPASVAASFEAPAHDFTGAVVATHCVLEAMRLAAPEARFVYLSSAAVYGNPQSLPITESSPTAPISPYGFHKRLGEQLVQQYARLYGIRGASARIFSAYGPGLRRQVIYELFRRVREGEVLQLDGTGDETRDFIHAADVARAVFQIAEQARGEGESYNVASGEETSLRTLAMNIRALTFDGPVAFSGVVRRGDPAQWRVDVSALKALGASPRVSLIEGLTQLRDWLPSS